MKVSTRIVTIALVVIQANSFIAAAASHEDLIYGYECKQSKCVKVELSEENFKKAISLPVCRLFCGSTIGTLWPKPTGLTKVDSYMAHIDIEAIDFDLPTGTKQAQEWNVNKIRFEKMVQATAPNRKVLKKGGYLLKVVVQAKSDEVPRLTLETDESYQLQITSDRKTTVQANITAKNFFGARHGLETLIQLIVYDNIRREIQIPVSAEIHDAPVYKWRGLLLDTSRNFYSVNAIKKTLDGMAMVKLNTFHWHITDSHSFPLEVTKQPELYKLGAYSPRKVYTHEDVLDVVEYGRARGVRVMPEFDAPAHVGEGWQHKNMTACFNAQPWKNFCVEPPCGQLDPTVNDMYTVLEDIYTDMFQLFNPDVFHMGGDEVSVNCWNSSTRIQNWMKAKNWGLEEADFMRLWGHFQTEALKKVDGISSEKNIPIILWTSRLTDVPYIDDYLDKERYIIQIWTTGADTKIRDILKRGFRIIVSNYDALYFDCGGGGWVTNGTNWCSPYIGWQKVYQNNLEAMASDYHNHVLGSEAAIWSEQIDEFTLDARFWPRASALAERLWSNPTTDWRDAEARMLIHREHMVENSIGAEALQPEWCLQNEEECPIDAYDPKF